MHSHFLPGVDDGARNMEESLAMLEKMEQFGYQKCILTPHVKSSIYPNTSESLMKVFKDLKEAAIAQGLRLELELGAEYFLDDYFITLLDEQPLLCFGKDRFVLVEFSFTNPPVYEEEAFTKIKAKGYTPILAHFERYIYFHGSMEAAQRYRELGVNIQLNLNSLTGHYGPEVRKQAERMMDECLVDFVGTDAHRIDHLSLLESNLSLPYVHGIGQRLLKNQAL
jgi:tyrosine-protein phosphatase YwqE